MTIFSYKQYKDFIIQYLIISEGSLGINKGVIQYVMELPIPNNLSIDEKERLREELFQHFGVVHQHATSIEDENFEPWVHKVNTDCYYSDRYKKYLLTRMPVSSIETIFKDSIYILDRLGNPLSDKPFKRKGLVVGDVQSGKTANYTALINLAADYGYKLVILIAGVHNNLRSQTQDRINTGFIGYEQEGQKVVGVGKFDSDKRPISFTNKQSDFNTASASTIGFSPEDSHRPIILVIKKNKTILENLQKWLRQNADDNAKYMLNCPTLIIDDEADNASVNTRDLRAMGDQPTAINRLIRELLNLFAKSSYVGYTATPFANIFMDIDAESEKLGKDLFPDNFIVSLESPSNYYGATRFFPRDGQSQFCEIIDDYHEALPIPLRNHQITDIPDSLRMAILHFFIAMAIKEIRKPNGHCSMLINVSHKREHHILIARQVEQFVTKLKHEIRFEGAKGLSNALNGSLIQCMNQVCHQYFDGVKISFDKILEKLVEKYNQVQVLQIHSNSNDRLNYDDYRQDGLKTIAIGGYSLSRGFTLEGLTTSYILRNTAMSDTLLQMGRWFGYRDGYEDLCKVFLTEKAYDWYAFIAHSMEELRNEFRALRELGMTPREYGLKVRACPAGLLITAKNKMLNSAYIPELSLSESQFTLPQLLLSEQGIRDNHAVLKDFIDNIYQYRNDWLPLLGNCYKSNELQTVRADLFFNNVPASSVVKFIQSFHCVEKDDVAVCLQYILKGIESELSKWDVALVSTDHSSSAVCTIGDIEFKAARRTLKSHHFNAENEPNSVYLADGGGRIMRVWEEMIGLSLEQIKWAEAKLLSGQVKQSAIYYRHTRKRPLLLIRFMDIHRKDDGDEKRQSLVAKSVIGFAISFPKSQELRSVSYHVNKVYEKQFAAMCDSDQFELEED